MVCVVDGFLVSDVSAYTCKYIVNTVYTVCTAIVVYMICAVSLFQQI